MSCWIFRCCSKKSSKSVPYCEDKQVASCVSHRTFFQAPARAAPSQYLQSNSFRSQQPHSVTSSTESSKENKNLRSSQSFQIRGILSQDQMPQSGLLSKRVGKLAHLTPMTYRPGAPQLFKPGFRIRPNKRYSNIAE